MTPRARSSHLLAVLVAAAAMLAGCPADSTTSVDESRLEVLRAEAEAAGAQVTTAVAGWQESDRLAPVRGHVYAIVVSLDTPDAVTMAQQQTQEAIGVLQANGWTVYLIACIPPAADDVNDGDDGAVLPPPLFNMWTFAAFAYKIIDGVSYFTEVSGVGAPRRRNAQVTLQLYAPYSGEAEADLFPDRPAATDVGQSCVAQAELPESLTSQGTPVRMDERGPDLGTTKPDGHR